MEKELVDEILAKADIVQVISSYIPVEKHGKSYVAICPFHDDTNPSMNISPEKRIFKCFVCGAGGNAISFVSKKENCSFDEAARKVANISNIIDPRLERVAQKKQTDPKKDSLYRCINDLAQYYQNALNSDEGKPARDYLESRNISKDDIRKYRIGYAPKDGKATIDFLLAKGHSIKSIEDIGISDAKVNGMSDNNAGRVMFPLAASDGQIVGFSGRRIVKDNSPKYVNTKETYIFNKSSVLYNYHNAREAAIQDKYIYVLEGFMDVIALGKAGIKSAVALMGVALTEEHIALLRRLKCEIRLCLDGDVAGQRGMMASIMSLSKAGLNCRIVDYGGDLRDPDDILQEEGKEALVKKMQNLIDPFDFQLNYYENVRKLTDQKDKKKVLSYFIPYVKNIPAGVERDSCIIKLSRITGYEVEAIRRQVNRYNPSSDEHDDESIDLVNVDWKSLNQPTSRLVGAERAIIYYMLQNYEAIEFYEKNINNMYDKVYEQIALYIQELSHPTKTAPDVATLIGVIGNSGNPDADELYDKITAIVADNSHPPYSERIIKEALDVMNEERDVIYQRKKFDDEATGKSDDEKAKMLAERSKNVWGKLKNKNGLGGK